MQMGPPGAHGRTDRVGFAPRKSLPRGGRGAIPTSVESASLEIGRLYGYRENPRARGSELLKVKLVAKVGRGGKVRIRFEQGPHPGLEEYVRTANLIVPWGSRQALLRDEERH